MTQASPATEVVIGTGISDTATLAVRLRSRTVTRRVARSRSPCTGRTMRIVRGFPRTRRGRSPWPATGPTARACHSHRSSPGRIAGSPRTRVISRIRSQSAVTVATTTRSNVVLPKTPTIVTHAVAGPVPLGSPISDTATIGNTAVRPNGDPAGGTVTFVAYGPNDPTCTTVAFHLGGDTGER